jgi:PQQ-dependent dehydrogenase (methanol/ethanol family)
MRNGSVVMMVLVVAAALCLPPSADALRNADWQYYGGDPGKTHWSELDQINTSNVQKLKVSWVLQLGTLRSQESTPLVVGDTLYVTSSFGPKHVFAVDARSGALRWRHDPEIAADVDPYGCCDVNSRGAAYAEGKLFVGLLDGRLRALDAATGKELWTATVVDYKQGSVITSPPVVAKNKVVIGFGGGEYGVRGSLQAYDMNTGREVWRTWLTPGAGEPGSETWKGDSWKTGGGAAWALGSYDPQLNLVFYGTSNPGPWNASVRGPDRSDYGNFTNLYTSASVALDGDTGKIVWYYQSTPHDAWDYDGVNELLVADLTIDGQKTPVVIKGDRNGFLYVIDRRNGKLISAKAFQYINWAKGVDMTTGRPIEDPEMRPRQGYRAKGICPAAIGAKNWMPMALNPHTGIIFLPTFNLCMDMEFVAQEYKRGAFYLAADFEIGKPGPGGFMGEAIAWDPVKQEAVWRNKEALPYVGGMLATAGGLVFHGNTEGWFKALDQRTGELLWKFNTGSGIHAGPMTYMIDGVQYVGVVSGRTHSIPPFFGETGRKMMSATAEGGALFVFELGS